MTAATASGVKRIKLFFSVADDEAKLAVSALVPSLICLGVWQEPTFAEN